MANKNSSQTSIDSIKHKDERANIPTGELRDFVEDDEKKPKPILYPRDPSFDPQLVWKGKMPVPPCFIRWQKFEVFLPKK